jgi:hypothetical protein
MYTSLALTGIVHVVVVVYTAADEGMAASTTRNCPLLSTANQPRVSVN